MPSAKNLAGRVNSERRLMFCLLQTCSMVLPYVALAWRLAKSEHQNWEKIHDKFGDKANFPSFGKLSRG